MTRNTPFPILGFALATSLGVHVGAIGLLAPFVSVARQALVVPDEAPAMLSITLVQAVPPVPAGKASELMALASTREARRRDQLVQTPPGGTSVILASAAAIAVAPREPALPRAPISAPDATLPTRDSVAPDSLPGRETGSSVAQATATAAPTRPASAPVAYLSHPSPSYPDSARRDGQEGLAVVEVLVTKSGIPIDVKVVTSSGVAALDDAAVVGVKRWLFTPATRDNEAIQARIRIPIRFRLNEDGS